MTVSAPPRPPAPARTAPDSKPLEREEIEALVEALIEEARREMRRRHRRYWALAALVVSAGVAVLVLLDGGASSRPASPPLSARINASAQASTSKIAFTQSAAGGQMKGGLYVMNADGSGKRRLAEWAGGTPSWSPDGRKIAFGGQVGGQVINVDGSGLQTLTADGGGSPAWSPDGRRIAFGTLVMNADGTGQRRLITRDGGPYGWSGPYVWSPDWQKIAFRSRRCGTCSHKFDIYVVNADGSGLRRLAPTTFSSTPAWSPDGRQIAYVRRYDIWVMNADGSGQRRLTSTAAIELSPAWSPDGRTIAFDRRLGRRTGWRNQGLTYEIYVMKADGSGQRRLARGASPLWSPDGKQIAFARIAGGGVTTFAGGLDNWDIFVMNADGTEQRNATRNRRWDDCCFAWSPGQK